MTSATPPSTKMVRFKLKPGMRFTSKTSEPGDDVIIVDSMSYYRERGPQYIIKHHNNRLYDDLITYGWWLDEGSVVDQILKKYES